MSDCCKLCIQTTSSRNENNADKLNTDAFLNSLLSCLLTVGLSKSIALPVCIQEVPGMNLGRYTRILKGIFMVFLSPSSYLKLGHDCCHRYLHYHSTIRCHGVWFVLYLIHCKYIYIYIYIYKNTEIFFFLCFAASL
jgi:hypothetical protein